MATGDDLRALMRLWPHGVSILSVDVEGDRMGVTVSSLVSLSLEPPLIGVSIGKDASCYELLRTARRCAGAQIGRASCRERVESPVVGVSVEKTKSREHDTGAY